MQAAEDIGEAQIDADEVRGDGKREEGNDDEDDDDDDDNSDDEQEQEHEQDDEDDDDEKAEVVNTDVDACCFKCEREDECTEAWADERRGKKAGEKASSAIIASRPSVSTSAPSHFA